MTLHKVCQQEGGWKVVRAMSASGLVCKGQGSDSRRTNEEVRVPLCYSFLEYGSIIQTSSGPNAGVVENYRFGQVCRGPAICHS